jgi:predicted flap endonuclease-1-like 5' DNA nuclease
MTYLLLETALLMLAAYFLGAVLACLFKRTFAAKPIGRRTADEAWAAPSGIPVTSAAAPVARSMPDLVKPKITPVRPDPARFERALTGAGASAAQIAAAEEASSPSPAPAAPAEPPAEVEEPPVVASSPELMSEPEAPQHDEAAARAPASSEIPRPADPAPISPPSRTPEPLVKAADAQHERHERGEVVRDEPVAPDPSHIVESESATPSGAEPVEPEAVYTEPEAAEPARPESDASEEAAAAHAEHAVDSEPAEDVAPELEQPAAETFAAVAAESAEPQAVEEREQPEATEEPAPRDSAPPEPAADIEAASDTYSATAAATEESAPAPAEAAAPEEAAVPAQPLSTPEPAEPEEEPFVPVAAGIAVATATAVAAGAASFYAASASPAAADERVTADDLTRIRRVDPAMQRRLNENGVWRFADIARWSTSDVNRFSQTLGVHPDRIEQENWVRQAEVLSRGGDAPVASAVVSTGAEAAAAAAAVAAAASIQPAPESSTAANASGSAAPDRLTRIAGLTPEFEQALHLDGITRFSQIAAWSAAEIGHYESRLGAQPGQIAAQNWVGQADVLARGGDPDAITPIATSPAQPAEPVEAPHAPAEASHEPVAATDDADASAGTRAPVTGLRSVKSEALIDPAFGWAEQSGGVENDLKRIRGIGVLIERKLYSLGITSYEQIANWTGADVYRLSQLLDFKGRIERENWIEQARILASGGQTEFARRMDNKG